MSKELISLLATTIQSAGLCAEPMVPIQSLPLKVSSAPAVHARTEPHPPTDAPSRENKSLSAQTRSPQDAQLIAMPRFAFTCQTGSSLLVSSDLHAPDITQSILSSAASMAVLIALAFSRTPLTSTGKYTANLEAKTATLTESL